jgi:hypothetical protein
MQDGFQNLGAFFKYDADAPCKNNCELRALQIEAFTPANLCHT